MIHYVQINRTTVAPETAEQNTVYHERISILVDFNFNFIEGEVGNENTEISFSLISDKKPLIRSGKGEGIRGGVFERVRKQA